MKKTTYLQWMGVTSLFLGLALPAGAQQEKRECGKQLQLELSPRTDSKANFPLVFETGKRKVKVPGKIQYYSYERGEWVFESLEKYAFNADGLLEVFENEFVASAEGKHGFSRLTLSDYDEFDMYHVSVDELSDDGVEWQKELKVEASYDDVAHDVRVYQKAFAWDSMLQDWLYDSESSYNWYKEIVRDEQGRMLSNLMWDSKEKRYGYLSYTFEYGAKPHAETVYVLMDNTRLYSYEKIDWHVSSNQYFWISNNLVWGLYDGRENLPAHYVVYELRGDGNKVLMGEVTYTYGEGDRLESKEYRDVQTKAVTRERYSYQVSGKNCNVVYYDSFRDNNGDGEPNDGDEIWAQEAYAELFDGYGNVTDEQTYRMDKEGTYQLAKGMQYLHTYDADGVRLETVGKEYDAETGVYEPMMRIVLSDFVEVETGIDETVADGLGLSVEGDRISLPEGEAWHYALYDLKGRCCRKGVASSVIDLSGMEQGLYMVCVSRDGVNRTFKVLL